jgi:hypothetical protein
VPGCLILALDRDGEAAAQTARAVDDAGAVTAPPSTS